MLTLWLNQSWSWGIKHCRVIMLFCFFGGSESRVLQTTEANTAKVIYSNIKVVCRFHGKPVPDGCCVFDSVEVLTVACQQLLYGHRGFLVEQSCLFCLHWKGDRTASHTHLTICSWQQHCYLETRKLAPRGLKVVETVKDDLTAELHLFKVTCSPTYGHPPLPSFQRGAPQRDAQLSGPAP